MNTETKPFGRPLSRLAVLTSRQIEHLNSWLDEGVPYREIVDLFRTEYQTEVPKTSIQRYYKRRALCTLGVDLTEAKEAAAEFSKYAVTGNASFSTNTLEILEEKAFDLAVAHHRDADADDLSTLERVSHLIHKAKHTAVRERHAQVQEDKCKLRAEELALKRELAHARLRKENADSSRTTSSDETDETNFEDAPPTDPASAHAPTASGPIAPFPRRPGPCPLPLEIVIENRRYAEKLLAGLVDPITGEELPWPTPAPTDAINSEPRSANSAPPGPVNGKP